MPSFIGGFSAPLSLDDNVKPCINTDRSPGADPTTGPCDIAPVDPEQFKAELPGLSGSEARNAKYSRNNAATF